METTGIRGLLSPRGTRVAFGMFAVSAVLAIWLAFVAVSPARAERLIVQPSDATAERMLAEASWGLGEVVVLLSVFVICRSAWGVSVSVSVAVLLA